DLGANGADCPGSSRVAAARTGFWGRTDYYFGHVQSQSPVGLTAWDNLSRLGADVVPSRARVSLASCVPDSHSFAFNHLQEGQVWMRVCMPYSEFPRGLNEETAGPTACSVRHCGCG